MKPPDHLTLKLRERSESFPMVTIDVKLEPAVYLKSFVIRMDPSEIVTATATLSDGRTDEEFYVDYEVGGVLDLRLFRIPGGEE